MKQLLNYCKSCTLEQIGEVKCSIAGLIKVSENYSVSIETKELSRELYQQMKHNDNDVIYLKTVDQYVTIMGYWVTDKHTRGVENVVFSITCEAKKSFWGSQYCNVHDNCFEEFFMQVTEGTELIGLTPYGILDTEDILFHIQSAIHIDTHMRTIGKKEGFSCFAAPEVQRIGADIRLGIQYGINYSQGSTLSISNVEEKIHSFILFLEILCGERISVTNIEVWIGKEMYKYLGLPMIPKERLNTFDREQFDSRGYVRRKIFKLSDFNQDIDEVICQFEKMYVEDRVAFEAYQQLMMDEELQIFTVNNFLKAMQMVEGIERLGDRESIEKEFKKEKHRIMKKLTDEKDKEFVKIYCNNLGETFRECLEKIVESCLMALSETDNSSCGDIITKMVNDRNVYTHASHKNDPLLSQTDLRGITYCFEVFFRIEVLIHLGLSKELIRKRCSYDGRFVAYYENLFGQTIGEADCGTGEYDDIMQSI